MPIRNVTIPESGRPALTVGPTVISGQHYVGEAAVPADSYQDQPLILPDGTAEVLVTAPIDETITVEVTGYLDGLAGTAEVTTERSVTVVLDPSISAELVGGSAEIFWQRNVIIPEPFTGDAICGKVICGVPPVLCGQNLKGDHYFDYTLDLDGGQITLTIEVKFALADSAALELDGGPVHVNPVLMPFECIDLDLDVSTCTDLDLVTVVCDSIDLTASPVSTLDLVESVCEPLDLEPLVPLEA